MTQQESKKLCNFCIDYQPYSFKNKGIQNIRPKGEHSPFLNRKKPVKQKNHQSPRTKEKEILLNKNN